MGIKEGEEPKKTKKRREEKKSSPSDPKQPGREDAKKTGKREEGDNYEEEGRSSAGRVLTLTAADRNKSARRERKG